MCQPYIENATVLSDDEDLQEFPDFVAWKKLTSST